MDQDCLRLLLMEQDPGFAGRFRELLGQMRELRVNVEEVAELQQGICRLSQDKSIDVVVMDLCLPDGAGFANLPLIHEQAPQAPVLVVGDIEEVQVGVETVHAGGQDYFLKSQIDPVRLERSLLYNVQRYTNDRAVQDSEQLYHGMIDDLLEGVFRTTIDGRYLFANKALARIYGYDSPSEMTAALTDIGRSLYVQPNRRHEFLARMQAHDELTGFESQVYRKDGTTIWISENCKAKRDTSGRLLCYEGTVEDITLRRKTEEDLRNSEALYHSLVETLPQNIFRKDLQGRFTFGNQQFCATVGHPLHEIVGKTDYDFFEPELARKYQDDDQRVLRTGKPYETVEENQPSGRQKVYVQVVKTPLYGADGKPMGLQGIFWDITAQKLADEKIRRANSQLALSRKQLREKNKEMEEDLMMAREVQQNIIPQLYPVFPVAAGSQISAIQFDHLYLPSGSVGGDFFTVSALSENEAAVFVCDVAGHGVRSALITAMIRALVEELKPLAPDPGKFLEKLNGDLCTILKNPGSPLLTTAFYLVANATTGQVVWANAGHPKPMLVRRSAGQVGPVTHSAKKSFPALGLFGDATYTWSEFKMEPGDLMLLFTDGLVEVHNSKDEVFSQDELQLALQRHQQLGSKALLDQLLVDIQNFAQGNRLEDDICMVAMRFIGRTPKKV